MSTAHIDTDRLVEQAPERWSEAEAKHLAECAECRLDLQLIRTARRLGVAQLAGFDAERVAQQVRQRIAEDRPEVPAGTGRRAGRWLAGLAAAAAVVLAFGIGTRSRVERIGASGSELAVLSILPELDGLSAPQLEEVLQSIPPASDALDHVDMAPLGELDSTGLERVLRSMEER